MKMSLYQNGKFYTRKKIGKSDFVPSEKYSSYATAFWYHRHLSKIYQSIMSELDNIAVDIVYSCFLVFLIVPYEVQNGSLSTCII